MLDLKSKLAAAGLVTPQDVERAERAQAAKKKKPRKGGARGKPGPEGPPRRPTLAVERLRDVGKGEQYDAVRRFVEQTRLDDPGRPPTEQAQRFHFVTVKGLVSRMVLEPELHGRVQQGGAGIVAFMSNHGLAHAVIPASEARRLAELFPLWLRVLEGHPGAGQIEAPPPEVTESPEAAEAVPSSEIAESPEAAPSSEPTDGA